MRKLIQGIVEFREKRLPQYAERFRELSSGQTPDALFITCSDSRVVPELLASTDPGDLFVVRNVGNMAPPATVEGSSTGDVSEASAIEYAVSVLDVEDIIVCGHSECGAMQAALGVAPVPDAPNLKKWLHYCTSAVFRLSQEGPLDPTLSAHNQLSQINVLVQLEHLMSYSIVRDRVQSGQLHLGGWWFDIATGEMQAYNRETRLFELIDRQAAERLLQRRG
ncbi:MAG TPA: carbonic anhydrase [Pirellulales bacterium]|nr:carbonic anhydrase [Pirellulales bacterium]